MTDNEIINYLDEWCNIRCDCMCPRTLLCEKCVIPKIKRILDLLNSQNEEKEALIAGQETLQNHIAIQRAEIERLKTLNSKLEAEVYSQKAEIDNYKQIAEKQQSLAMDRHLEIERQKAKIERLKAEIERFRTTLNIDLENYASEYDNKIKAEAVKEFAERLKCGVSITSGVITCEDVNNLVKEMVGDV